MIRTNRQASDRDRHAETHRCFIASCGVIVSLGAVTRCPMVPRDSNSREPRSMTKGIAKMSCVLGRAVGSLDNSCMTNARNGLLYTAGSGAGSSCLTRHGTARHENVIARSGCVLHHDAQTTSIH